MTGPAVTIGPEEAVASAARRMHDRGVKRLPVVDHAGALIGISPSTSSHSQAASPTSVVRPGRILTWRALTSSNSNPRSSSTYQ
jgi:CBS-domain-containing membrane protein